MCVRRAQRGVTLVELIIAIVIVGVSLAAVLSVFVVTAQHSADPMVRQQAQMIAESYLDEILIKRFYDPDTNTVCPANEGSRDQFDTVCDYNTLPDNVVRNQAGSAIAALSAYNVAVSVDSGAGVALNGINNTGAIRVLRVDVTVTGPGETILTLSGYRTNYECDLPANPECKPL